LALRLASLEKYMESAEPMPFIVDDVRWISSRMAPLGMLARKPRGSSCANARVSGASRFIYTLSGKVALQSVVFPLWRGPVTVTTGYCWLACTSVGWISRKIIIILYIMTKQSSNCKYMGGKHTSLETPFDYYCVFPPVEGRGVKLIFRKTGCQDAARLLFLQFMYLNKSLQLPCLFNHPRVMGKQNHLRFLGQFCKSVQRCH